MIDDARRAGPSDPRSRPQAARALLAAASVVALGAGCEHDRGPRRRAPATPSPGAPSPATAEVSSPEFRAPRLVKEVAPVYPEALLGSGRGGDVVLELRIEVTGKVGAVNVKESRGAELDAAAVAAARQWEYTPTIFKGRPALMYLTVTVPVTPPLRPPAASAGRGSP
jgi:TonB family protein